MGNSSSGRHPVDRPMSVTECQTKVKKKIAEAVDKYMNGALDEDINFEDDLRCVDPKERLSIVERYAAYIMPKYQSVQMEAILEGRKTLSERLKNLAEGKKVQKTEDEE